ncbi:heterokaryon incompatibility protein-domain-containing protein, partial [Dichomitus squalens]
HVLSFTYFASIPTRSCPALARYRQVRRQSSVTQSGLGPGRTCICSHRHSWRSHGASMFLSMCLEARHTPLPRGGQPSHSTKPDKMRLLDTHTGLFVDFNPKDDEDPPRYAILSHRWSDKEQTYRQLRKIQARYYDDDGRPKMTPTSSPRQDPSPGYRKDGGEDVSVPFNPEGPPLGVEPEPIPSSLTADNSALSPFWGDPDLNAKIRKACETAREYGYDYIWIDSGCIDQSSSSELTESINSMYKWYGDASLCLAYLADASDVAESGESIQGQLTAPQESEFRGSVWFTRGWTLQELVAPRRVVFLSKGWRFLGTKTHLAGLLEKITSIDQLVLLHQIPLTKVSVAKRMS